MEEEEELARVLKESLKDQYMGSKTFIGSSVKVIAYKSDGQKWGRVLSYSLMNITDFIKSRPNKLWCERIAGGDCDLLFSMKQSVDASFGEWSSDENGEWIDECLGTLCEEETWKSFYEKHAYIDKSQLLGIFICVVCKILREKENALTSEEADSMMGGMGDDDMEDSRFVSFNATPKIGWYDHLPLYAYELAKELSFCFVLFLFSFVLCIFCVHHSLVEHFKGKTNSESLQLEEAYLVIENQARKVVEASKEGGNEDDEKLSVDTPTKTGGVKASKMEVDDEDDDDEAKTNEEKEELPKSSNITLPTSREFRCYLQEVLFRIFERQRVLSDEFVNRMYNYTFQKKTVVTSSQGEVRTIFEGPSSRLLFSLLFFFIHLVSLVFGSITPAQPSPPPRGSYLLCSVPLCKGESPPLE